MIFAFVKKHCSVLAAWLLILSGLLILLGSFGPIIYSEVWYSIKKAKNQIMFVDIKDTTKETSLSQKYIGDSVFARFLSAKPILIEPINRDFSIVIEKIGVNAPVVANVSISDPQTYANALQQGVAHAINSQKPSSNPGNTYIFAHASLNFWELGKFATTFNLLRKLEVGDPIYIFYKNNIYVYKVANIERFAGWNTYPITRPVIEPILTLQTCDPPGTTLNRLVVTAKLSYIDKSTKRE
jgi:LPXTG-site transpeptidase (sortase) family protein